MTPLNDQLREAAGELERLGVSFALIGGLAVSVRTEPRFTRDIDFAIAVEDDAAAEALVRSLRGAGYNVEAHLEHLATDRLAAVRLRKDAEGPLTDLLFASSGIETEVVRDAEPTEVFSGLVLPVAQIHHLLALKLLAHDDERRPQDRIDIVALVAAASPADIAAARGALGLIEERGFARGRNLLGDLATFVGG